MSTPLLLLAHAASRSLAPPSFWLPFIHPIKLPFGARLWMLIPLVVCVALVYRATRAKSAKNLAWPTALTSINIIVGMALIAFGFYAAHEIVLAWS
ncbi:MAG: hypothetical protein AB7Q17_02885 [Phycisphaerae bacterium]